MNTLLVTGQPVSKLELLVRELEKTVLRPFVFPAMKTPKSRAVIMAKSDCFKI